MAEIESWEMFRRCAEGCSEGWESLLARHQEDLRGLVGRALARVGVAPSRDLVEELLQELLCRLLRGRARAFAGGSDGAMWRYLARMARSVAVDHWRRSRAEKRRVAEPDDVDACTRRLLGVARAPCPEQRLLDREERRLAARRWALLAGSTSPLAPRVLRLALVEGWSSREISRCHRDLTPNQVDRLVCRLRRCLAERGIAVPRRGSYGVRVAA